MRSERLSNMKTPTNKAANSQVKNIPNNNAGQPNSKLYFSIKPLIDKKKSSLNDKENVRYQVIDKKPVKFEEKEEERSSRYSVRRAYDNGILANPKLQAAKHEKIEEGSQANPFLLENCRSYRILHPQTKQPTNRDSSFTPHAGNRNHSGIRGAKDGLSNFGVLLGYNNQNPALFDKRNNSSNISSKSYEILDALSKKEGDRSPVRKNLEASRNKTHENFNKIIEQSTKVIVPQSANFFYDDLKGDRHAPPSSFPRTPHSPNESYLFKNALDRSLLSRVNQGSPISSIVRTKTMDKSGHSALNRSDVSTKTKNSNGNNSFLTKRGEDNDLSRVICHNQDSAMRGGMSKTWVKSGLMDSREEISTISKAPMLTLENPRMPTNQRSNTIDRLAVDSTEKSVQKKKLYNEIENMFSKECHQSSKDSSASHSKAREYELQKCIGQGAYAKVYKAIHLPTKTKVAIKLYEKSKLSEKLRQKSIKREIKILSRLNHPNIVNFIDCFSTKNHIYLVMELVRGLSLYELLKKQPDRKIKESNGKTIIKQILKAMSYCHSKCVSHRDIKLENVIISGNGEVKVIDFGFSTCIPNEKKVKMFCGTPSYMAPEIVQKIEYCGPPVDIWATGVLFYVLISGKFPFRGSTDKKLYQRISDNEISFPEEISKETREIIELMMSKDPDDRPTAVDLLNHCYFKRRKEEAISARPTTDFNRTQGSTRNNSTILKEERSPRSSKMINPTKTQHLFDDMLNILGREGKTQPWEEPRRTQQTGATSKSPSPMVSKSNLIAKAPTEVWGPNKHSPVEILRKETASFKPREEKNNCQAIPGYQVESKENVKERYKKYENLKVAAAQNRRTHREDKGKYEKGDFTKFLDRK